MSNLGNWRSTTKIGKIGRLSEKDMPDGLPLKIEPLGGADLSRSIADELDEEFKAMVDEVGEEGAREAQRLRREGLTGTLPELLTEAWLRRRRVPFTRQYPVPEAGARVDFIVRDELAWRINGEYWHKAGDVYDRDQKYALQLMGFQVVDIWETQVYRAREYTLSAALRGREVGHGTGGPIGGQRGLSRRQ